ncbi:Aldo/keto reductase [Dacryopinax primogenitus]|uniref:Aldo/keto reductase n=1 Tax=Dacryopinax primogenitus (strain DJM 731) TaxID=1858805 RepID=M5FVH4_DACPD|nr:Aldo/keto reductase [Dacryopinax primogenitus]EJT97331.1 Aldo/keto reductase [Dacryopinax primogenitus]
MGDTFAPARAPPTKLGEHRILCPTAGIRVSPLVLGGMSLGDAWKDILGGGIGKQAVFEILDTYWEAGGNFIDTANNYQDEQSEKWIGEWMEQQKNRDELVIATKYSIGYNTHERKAKTYVNYTGNHKKSLVLSLRASLEKLKTSYVDILYVHWWDYSTSIPELMRALDDVVKSGQVLYLGISDTPAWIVTKANEYARAHALTPFVIYQGEWSCMKRDFERDILPMCMHEGMAVAPWGVIAGGRLRTQAQLAQRIKQGGNLRFGMNELSENEKKMSAALEKVANDIGGDASLANVAISYCLHKQPYVFPIIGGKKISHLKENIKALSIRLTREQIDLLDAAIPFDIGFPQSFLGGDPAMSADGKSTNFILNVGGDLTWVKAPQAID